MANNRLSLILCVGLFGLLMVLAGVFYLERMSHLDMAFQTFLILKSGDVAIQSGRFGAVATQIWPWATQALGGSLKSVLFAYSLGHVLWPALLAAFCWQMGQWRWSLVIGLVATLMTTQTFYWLSEMPQGLVFLCAIFAWMHKKGSLAAFQWWQWPLWLAALVTAFYFHPLVMYALGFICVFYLLDPSKSSGWKAMHLSALGIFAGLAVLKYKILKLDWYDAVAIKRQEAFGKLWPHWLDIESNRTFLKWTASDYYLVCLVWLGCVGYYCWNRNWKKGAWVALYPAGFILMVNVPYYDAVGQQFYMENLYLPLAVFASIPLVFDVLNSPKGNDLSRNGSIALGILFALNLLRIEQAHGSWTERLEWEQGVLKQTSTQPQRKILLAESQVPMEVLKMSWGSPYEFLILSSLQQADSARCLIISDNPARFDTLLNRPRLFLGSFKNYPFEDLPKRYFNVQDTSRYVRW